MNASASASRRRPHSLHRNSHKQRAIDSRCGCHSPAVSFRTTLQGGVSATRGSIKVKMRLSACQQQEAASRSMCGYRRFSDKRQHQGRCAVVGVLETRGSTKVKMWLSGFQQQEAASMSGCGCRSQSEVSPEVLRLDCTSFAFRHLSTVRGLPRRCCAGVVERVSG